jgi:hypothetical protein
MGLFDPSWWRQHYNRGPKLVFNPSRGDTTELTSRKEVDLVGMACWLIHGSLDTIGITGFSHDFGSLDGKTTSVTDIFDSFGASEESALATFLFLLAWTFPVLTKAPTLRTKLIQKLNQKMSEISNVLLTRTREEREVGVMGDKEEKSIIGLLSTLARYLCTITHRA